jgi:hypothetical protein
MIIYDIYLLDGVNWLLLEIRLFFSFLAILIYLVVDFLLVVGFRIGVINHSLMIIITEIDEG